MAEMRQLTKLLHPFPQKVIHSNPSGGGSYVKHSTVQQRLMDVLGLVDFELVQVIRGTVAGKPGNPKGSSERARTGTPDLADSVVGVVARMTATVDGQRVVVEEAGDCEQPHNWPHDGARMKDAMSDAYKRCLATGTTITTSEGVVPIEHVRIGDMVQTRSGWRKVTDAGLSYPERVPTLTVHLFDGRRITCTPEHRFFVPGQGFLQASELQRGAMLLSCPAPLQHRANLSTSTASRSGSTAVAPTSPAGTATASGQWPSIGTSTRSTTARSLLDGTSITSTGTPATTTRRTWQPSTRITTSLSIGLSATLRGRSGAITAVASTSPADHGGNSHGALAPAGTRTAASGPPTARLERAACAATSSPSTTGETSGRPAADHAQRRGESSSVPATTAGLTSPPVAPGLGSALALVSSVTPSAPEYVYSLTIDGVGEYYAGGVLTHNCAMRLGVGLHLWSQDDFYLSQKLMKQDEAAAVPPVEGNPK